jgi:hypothetical protein
VGAVLVLDGAESIQRADRGRVGLGSGCGVRHGDATARRDCGEKKPVELSGEVEFDEVYVVAGHKGHPEAVLQQGRPGRRRRLKGAPGRGILDKEKPPIFGMIQRGGEVVIRMLANVRQQTIQPLIRQTIQPGTLISTDEYAIYNQLEAWGYAHKTVNHAQAE